MAEPDPGMSMDAVPKKRPLSVGSLLFYFAIGAVLFAFVATAGGALVLSFAGGDLEGTFGASVAGGIALTGALIVPSLLALTMHAHAVSATRIFAGWNLVIALVMVLLLPSATGKALALHGGWPFLLTGSESPVFSEGMRVLAELLPGDGAAAAAREREAAAAEQQANTVAADAAKDEALSASAVFSRARDSVVFIGVRKDIPKDGFEATIAKMFGLKELAGHGSGFVIGDGGLIVTNHHVIGDATSAYVRFADGTRIDDVEVLAKDPANDLALIRVAQDKHAPLPLAPSDDVAVGADAFAIGSPLGLDFTLTAGIISARREQQDTTLLQMQTTIAPGSSGGPVLDDRARLIGVSTATRGAGLNLAVHARHVRALLDKERAPAKLARWPRSLELKEMQITGAEALPTVRAQLEAVAKVLAGGVGGCVDESPDDGARVELILPPGLFGQPVVKTNLQAKESACVEQSTRLVGMQLAAMMKQNKASGATLTCSFESPAGFEDGLSVPKKRVELSIHAGDPTQGAADAGPAGAAAAAAKALEPPAATEKPAKRKRRIRRRPKVFKRKSYKKRKNP